MSASIYGNSDFWLNSPALIFIKLGAILILVAFSWVWNLQLGPEQWSWVRQFGMTSLLVYWVHIELVYGRWMGAFKENLTVGETIAASTAVIGADARLVAAAHAQPVVRSWYGSFSPAPRRVSGD